MDGGAALAGAYSAEVVEPLIERAAPGVPFSTARLGSGSDVLGYDDATSRDHDWGLRLTVVVPEGRQAEVDAVLERELPGGFRRHPVRFATTWDDRTRHRAEVLSVGELCRSRTGIDPSRALTLLDRLSLTGQAALEVTAGPVFRDDEGSLRSLRALLAEPPEDVRRWAVASAWAKLAEELPFVGRTGDRGDDAGSRLLAARMTQTAMRLGFLLERRWAPYSKWLGTAFAALPVARTVAPHLAASLAASSWRAREDALAAAIDGLAQRQAATGLPAIEPTIEPFWDRPYRSIRDIASVVRSTITDPVLREAPLVGLPDLWTDDVRLLVDHDPRRRMVAGLLGEHAQPLPAPSSTGASSRGPGPRMQ